MEFINVKLSDIGEVVGGATPSTKNPDNYDGNIVWITPKDLAGYNKVYISKGERNITEIGFKSCSTKILPKNSVLFSSRAPIGYVAISENDLCTNQGFKSIIPNNKIDYKFLYYLLKHNKNYIASKGSGSTFKEVSGSVMKGIELSIPKNIHDQKKISKILFDIDKKIELNNEINNNLYDIQKCYFKEIFREQEYHEMKLDDLFIISAGGDAPKDKKDLPSDEYIYPIISNGIENEGIYGYSKEYKIDKKSVTISARGTIGYKVLRDYNYYPIVRLISLFPKDDSISSEYLFYALDDIQILGTGTTQQQLTVPMVKDIRIKVYDVNLIKKFTNYSISLNRKIDNNKLENRKLSELRDTLLPKLMNGEIDLDNIEI